jgi:hypothetical protein
MDPSQFVAPNNPLGSPAPFWFIELFKVLGFILHIIPMNLWYAGIIIAMLLYWKGSEHGQLLSKRLMKQMPIIVAFGINLGIVPLLFVQVSYYKVFYPATILMGWFWFSIFGMLIFAYYGVYIYAAGLKNETKPLGRIQITAGWVSSILFISIGFIFANSFSLMTNLGAWESIWHQTSVAGAPLGISLNTLDPSLIPRWLMMFGIALMTTAAYISFDTWMFAKKESDEYKKWAIKFSLNLYGIGIAWFALMGSLYVFGTWSPEVRKTMLSTPFLILTFLTAISPGLPFMCIAAQRKGTTKLLALLTIHAQLLVIIFNAISRQLVQNIELKRYFDPSAEPVNLQLSPLILFLILFIFGLAVIFWMLRKVATSRPPVL